MAPQVEEEVWREEDGGSGHRRVSSTFWICYNITALGERVVLRLRELAPRGQRESGGGGIHAT